MEEDYIIPKESDRVILNELLEECEKELEELPMRELQLKGRVIYLNHKLKEIDLLK